MAERPARQKQVAASAMLADTPVVVFGRIPPALGRCGPAHQAVGGLAGRTIEVGAISDIDLGKGEVVLTFDDGPRPVTTPKVLAALGEAGVRATFFPVGQMARTYPKLLREVALRGHTIGHHTDRHAWLSKMRFDDAMAEIAKGERAIARALSGSGAQAAPFFRFPYLAHTSALRKALAKRGTVVVDVDIDAADYKRSSGAVVRQRTMARLRRQGRGVVLFHDIHARTASMLPGFLRDLKAGGFRVVHMVPRGGGRCAGRVG
ncbi:MAG: polysaccharide deacetylase family protein [Pseudomonadota bacterium]